MISDDEDLMLELAELIAAIREVSHGRSDVGSEPLGLEGVSMSLCGEGTPGKTDSVARGLHDIAEAIRELAHAIANRGP